MRNKLELINNRQSPEKLLAGLLSDSPGQSIDAGDKLIREARSYGVGLRDYLTLAIDPNLSEHKDRYSVDGKELLGGYEAALSFLNLPVRENLKGGIVLELASETFQTFPGTRAMFPEVIDDMLRWKYRQDVIESAAPMIANSRTITGVEMISTVVDDAAADYQHAQPIAESGRIPIRSIRTTQNQVGIWKHGMGYKTTYEFERRARLDVLTPYAARAEREIAISKVKVATTLLVSGDSVHAAASEVDQTSFVSGATTGKINYQALLMWLVDRAKAGTPVDTVVGTWDAYLQWLMLFAVPTSTYNRTDAENLAASGFQIGGVPLLRGTVDFALSTSAPANKLIGFSRADTLEELVEAGSLISESERSMRTQEITYYRTENVGYRLVYGDTRSIFDFGN